MPNKVNRKPSYATAGDVEGEYIIHNSKGKISKTRDKQVLRGLIGDKDTSSLVEDSKKWHAARRKAREASAKAKADKEGKDAIDLVRRKKSTNRDDYKD